MICRAIVWAHFVAPAAVRTFMNVQIRRVHWCTKQPRARRKPPVASEAPRRACTRVHTEQTPQMH